MRITANAQNTHFEDGYEAFFNDFDAFQAEIKQQEKESEWYAGIPSNSIRLMGAYPVEHPSLLDKYPDIPPEVLMDTLNSTKLLISDDGNEYQCLRDVAISSLLNTAKINGSALGKLVPADFENVLNTCLKIADGSSLMLMRRGKVSAITSANQYEIMPQPVLLGVTTTALRMKFGKNDFLYGNCSHGYTNAVFELYEAKDELNKKYAEAIGKTRSLHTIDFMPIVRFSTSDVGFSAATASPEFRLRSGATFRVSSPIKVEHKKNSRSESKSGVQRYEEALNMLFPQFMELAKLVEPMARLIIQHPKNAILLMAKKVGLPKKYAVRAQEDIDRLCGDAPCSMHDVYLSIAECTAFAAQEGVTGKRLDDISDCVAKVLCLPWSEYDVGGDVNW